MPWERNGDDMSDTGTVAPRVVAALAALLCAEKVSGPLAVAAAAPPPAGRNGTVHNGPMGPLLSVRGGASQAEADAAMPPGDRAATQLPASAAKHEEDAVRQAEARAKDNARRTGVLLRERDDLRICCYEAKEGDIFLYEAQPSDGPVTEIVAPADGRRGVVRVSRVLAPFRQRCGGMRR